jgi:neutral ceramidase
MKIAASFIASLLLISVSAAAELRVGAAAEVITPPAGAPLAGYYSARSAQGVLDDLFAKAIVIERDGVKVALVVCDLVTLPRHITEQARKLIETSGVKIPGVNVMISATHTHTGPIVMRNSSQDPIEVDASEKSKAYAAALPGLIAKAVQNADAKLAPARAMIGVGREEHVSFNRRYFMQDGTVGWNPGKQNPKVVKPAGPIDPEVPVVLFESADDTHKPLAMHVSFAMHLDTTGGEQISADYPAALAAILAKVKGPDMLTVFATGACGDINHINTTRLEKQEGGLEAKRIGTILAGEVIKTSTRLSPVADGAIRTATAIVPLPLPEVNPADFEEAKQVVLKPNKARMAMDRVKAFKVLDVAARKGVPIDAEVQVVALGNDVAWVALPGEIFAELGLDVKKRSPFKHTIVVELANGSVGYVPTKRAFAEGNYEPVSARCAAGSGEMLVDAAVKLLTELHK